MDEVAVARTFSAGGPAYDRFMGRYSVPLADGFADLAGITAGTRVLDVGCGPGALTGVAVRRTGASNVCAVDPTPAFVEACRSRHPGVDVRQGSAERLPFDDEVVDRAAAELVVHFLSDPDAAMREMVRVVRPAGVVAACVWDFAEGMQMLRAFWDAALALDPEAPDEARVLRFGGEGELSALFTTAGLTEVTETVLTVRCHYSGFDELWDGFLAGVGPAGAYCVALPDEHRERLHRTLFEGLGAPVGGFSLGAVARAARGIR